MVGNDVPIIIPLLNLAALLIFGLMALVFIHKGLRLHDENFSLLSLTFLFLTLFRGGMDGVHRWIKVGIINVNVAMVVLPITLLASYNLLMKQKVEFVLIIIISIAMLLALQPDAI